MKWMNVWPMLAASGLLLSAGAACAQGIGMDMQPAGRAAMEWNADESAQDATDMYYGPIAAPGAQRASHAMANASYGGTEDTHGEAGAPCTPAAPCGDYRGH
jgi:hypothetical protein